MASRARTRSSRHASSTTTANYTPSFGLVSTAAASITPAMNNLMKGNQVATTSSLQRRAGLLSSGQEEDAMPSSKTTMGASGKERPWIVRGDTRERAIIAYSRDHGVDNTACYDDVDQRQQQQRVSSLSYRPPSAPRAVTSPSKTRADVASGEVHDDSFGSCGTGVLKVGPCAKARLYREYCKQKIGDYALEHRRHGGKDTLERIRLLTR